MSFYSILFESKPDCAVADDRHAPDFFADLNCDQIVAAVTARRDEYHLKPFFYCCLLREDAIRYRQEVMQDLESGDLHAAVATFAQAMQATREHLARVKKLHYKEQRQARFLDAIERYCESVSTLARDLKRITLHSRGFLQFRDFLLGYAQSPWLGTLLSQARKLRTDLSAVRYCVQIRGSGFNVRGYAHEIDYSAEVEATFEKFKQGAARDYRVKFSDNDEMNHVEAKIAEFIARLHPQVFGALHTFCEKTGDFIDPTVASFDREVQFYIAYLEYIAPLRRAGLTFCYPRVSIQNKNVLVRQGFDLALAHKRIGEGAAIVCNDFCLEGAERILVLSGPNQGGKTTFARAFGQIHYLACIGCPVPGSEAQLFLFDRMFTHFEKEETVQNLRGKLENDLLRIRAILRDATARSILILNEAFTSTTIHDETFLSEKTMEKLVALGALCVWVTFVDELASFAAQTVSLVSTVAPDNPALRTFKIVRRPADDRAYAMAIAHKYGLSYRRIRERVQS
jgi:DNA mismatch repair protein MutS